MRNLSACSNCCFNALQYGSLGTPYGYCVKKYCLLKQPDETTCGQHLRKDVMSESMERHHNAHAEKLQDHQQAMVFIHRKDRSVQRAQENVHFETNVTYSKDRVTDVVFDYGERGSSFSTLGRLNEIPGARAELAMISLGRAYVRNCFKNDRKWTSGLNLLWWIKEKLAEDPNVQLSDIRIFLGLPSQEQLDLETLSLLMLRLKFISDVGSYAKQVNHTVGELEFFADEAATAMRGSTSPKKLLSWLRRAGAERLERVFPRALYRELREEVMSPGQ